jgi:hypothetical protein
MTDDDFDCQKSILRFIVMEKNGVPHFVRTFPSDALADLDRKRFGADVRLAHNASVAVNLELASVLDAKYIDFSISFRHGDLESTSQS